VRAYNKNLLTGIMVIFILAVQLPACNQGSSSTDNTDLYGQDASMDGSGDADTDSDSDNDSDSDSDTDPGWNDDDGGTVEVQDGGVVITEEDGTVIVCYKTECDGRLLACGDCEDNDEDGKVDWRDRECLGPCDNTEGPALISDVGGVTGSTCHIDCYFDYGNGMGTGSDDCWWDHQCDPLEPEKDLCPYDNKVANNEHFCPDEQSDLCDTICLPFTPNGCDCFGCCTFPELEGKGPGGSDGYVWIGAKDSDGNGICTLADVSNPEKCPPCTPIDNCFNECGRCEICIGKPLPPDDCFDNPDGPADGQCPDDLEPCGLPGLDPCDPGYYCVSGCCQATNEIE